MMQKVYLWGNLVDGQAMQVELVHLDGWEVNGQTSWMRTHKDEVDLDQVLM